jgi:hypothetical protein
VEGTRLGEAEARENAAACPAGVMPHGPTPCSCTIAPSAVQAKWWVLGCMIATLPTGNTTSREPLDVPGEVA